MRYKGGADLSGMQFFNGGFSPGVESVVLNHASEQLNFTEKNLKQNWPP